MFCGIHCNNLFGLYLSLMSHKSMNSTGDTCLVYRSRLCIECHRYPYDPSNAYSLYHYLQYYIL